MTAKSRPPRPDRAARIAFVAKFSAGLVLLYLVVAGNAVNDRVIVPFTELVTLATAAVLRWGDPGVATAGTVIHSPRFAMDVHNGCNGIEAMIFLCAAIVAFPATLRSRAAGLLAAIVAIQFLNVGRLTSLFWLGSYHRKTFELFHVAVWQSLVILAAIALFVIWSLKFAEKPVADAR